jgi:hypothetical protein
MSTHDFQDIPIACSLSAQQLSTRKDENEGLLHEIEEVRELEDGYALKFTGRAEQVQGLLQFITQERSCCPFFRFELRFEPQNGPVWLSLSGPDGTKGFIQEVIGATPETKNKSQSFL